MSSYNPKYDLAFLNQRSADCLPELLGIQVVAVAQGLLRAEMPVRKTLLASNGYMHAGSIVTLADTACGYGCLAHLPEGARSFTTIELKSNHLGTALEGIVEAEATAVHLGGATQVWDAKVTHRDTGKTMALFRCTQMILWPRERTAG
ncbi:MAG: putative thioesterase family protein [Polaromonas sp.]|nr:putative thioesterase family protein [Polaromonas sp.]